MIDAVTLLGAVYAGLGVLAAILLPLALLAAARRPSTRDLRLPLAAGVFLAAWYGVVTTLAGAGGLQSGPGRVPTIFLVLVALGLFDLALALTLGVGSGPSPLHFIPATPSSGLLSTGAFALVPSFIVPLDIWLHVVSLRFLLAQRRQPRPSPSPVPASAA
jgi:hypothetical protein